MKKIFFFVFLTAAFFSQAQMKPQYLGTEKTQLIVRGPLSLPPAIGTPDSIGSIGRIPGTFSLAMFNGDQWVPLPTGATWTLKAAGISPGSGNKGAAMQSAFSTGTALTLWAEEPGTVPLGSTVNGGGKTLKVDNGAKFTNGGVTNIDLNAPHTAVVFDTSVAVTNFVGSDIYAANYDFLPGNSAVKNTRALQRISALINSMGGKVHLFFERGVYFIGQQTFAGATGKGYAYYPVDYLKLTNCKDVIIEGNGATIKFADGLKIGAWNPVTGMAYSAGGGSNLDYWSCAGTMISVNNSQNVKVFHLNLDGNIQGSALGGNWGSGYETGGIGIQAVGNISGLVVSNCHVNYFTTDAIGLIGYVYNANAAAMPVLIEHCDLSGGGRQGISYDGGNGLTVNDCVMSNIGWTKNTAANVYVRSGPGAGIDIEPEADNNNVQVMCLNTVLNHCTIKNNWGISVLITNNNRSKNVTLNDCQIENNYTGALWLDGENVTINGGKVTGTYVQGYPSQGGSSLGYNEPKRNRLYNVYFSQKATDYVQPRNTASGNAVQSVFENKYALLDGCTFDLDSATISISGTEMKDVVFKNTSTSMSYAFGRFKGLNTFLTGTGGISFGDRVEQYGRIFLNGTELDAPSASYARGFEVRLFGAPEGSKTKIQYVNGNIPWNYYSDLGAQEGNTEMQLNRPPGQSWGKRNAQGVLVDLVPWAYSSDGNNITNLNTGSVGFTGDIIANGAVSIPPQAGTGNKVAVLGSAGVLVRGSVEVDTLAKAVIRNNKVAGGYEQIHINGTKDTLLTTAGDSLFASTSDFYGSGKTILDPLKTKAKPNLATIDSLRASKPADGTILHTGGYYTVADGGGNKWRFNASSTTADDSATVVGSGTGRWFAIFEGPVRAEQFGAKGDGTTNDTRAIQKELNYCARYGTTMSGHPVSQYAIYSTVNFLPQAGNASAYISFDMRFDGQRDVANFKWKGGDSTAMFSVKALKNATISGVNLDLGSGYKVAGWDIGTDSANGSTSFVKFDNCQVFTSSGTLTGNQGKNNVAWRLGHISSDASGDISEYEWINCIVGGTTKAGETGWLVEGPNALGLKWYGGYGYNLDLLYSNATTPGATWYGISGGGSAAYFYGLGGHDCNTYFNFFNEGSYYIGPARFEHGKRFVNTATAGFHPTIKVSGITASELDPTDGRIFNIDCAASLSLDACHFKKSGTPYGSSFITLGGFTNEGDLHMSSGAVSNTSGSLVSYNPSSWHVYLQGVGKLSSSGTVSYFASINTDVIVGEVLTGTANGTNTAFSLAYTPATGREIIYLNGVRQKRGVDYTISGANVTMASAPTFSPISDYTR